ncbi:HEAT repeat domain-containing protein [Candidatus Pacearchaeota archaeon]|nr:HEAT repeat domain-containing protein [Candidatus Pacearchaeota archaeon]
MESLEKTLSFRTRSGDIRWKNMFFEKSRFVYKPVKDWICDMGGVSHLSSYLINLEKSLPLLRMSILDESLPLYVFNLPGLFAGGRVTDAMILGMMKYSKALPELLEVAEHDLTDEMRGACTESIGEMKKESWGLVSPLCDILLQDKNFYVKKETSKTLGKIGNTLALNPLRDSFEEARFAIRDYELRGYPFKFESNDPWEEREADSACFLLENCIVSLFRLDKKSGREVLSIGLNDWSRVVYHWSKRAAFFSGYYDRKK